MPTKKISPKELSKLKSDRMTYTLGLLVVLAATVFGAAWVADQSAVFSYSVLVNGVETTKTVTSVMGYLAGILGMFAGLGLFLLPIFWITLKDLPKTKLVRGLYKGEHVEYYEIEHAGFDADEANKRYQERKLQNDTSKKHITKDEK